MYRYSRYIAAHLIHSALLITFSLTSIIWLTQALRFMDFIVNQGVSVALFLKLTLLLVPSLLLLILPPALFCAVLFVYHRLKLDSELIVLQAAGLSRWRLAAPALHVATAVTLIAYAIALYLQPVSHSRFREMQFFLRNHYASILLQEGVFLNPVKGLTVFIRERDRNGALRGILVHDNRQPDTAVTMMAEEGRLAETPQGPRFLLLNGNRQEVRGGKLSFLTFEHYTMDVSLYAQSMTARHRDMQELLLHELWQTPDAATPAEINKRRAEAHQRLLWPLYPVSLTLVALAALLSGEFNRRGHWRRIALAAAFGAAIVFLGIGLRGMMALRPPVIVAAYLNVLLPSLAAAWVLRGYTRNSAKKVAFLSS